MMMKKHKVTSSKSLLSQPDSSNGGATLSSQYSLDNAVINFRKNKRVSLFCGKFQFTGFDYRNNGGSHLFPALVSNKRDESSDKVLVSCLGRD